MVVAGTKEHKAVGIEMEEGDSNDIHINGPAETVRS
jgi:hypothetical protein